VNAASHLHHRTRCRRRTFLKPIALSFTNLRASTADEIRFVVQYASRTEHITDKGAFVQNVTVAHAFNGFYNSRYVGIGPSSCRVEYAHFLDGSTWTSTTPATIPPPS
jgi:hypothetical protein